MRATAVPGAVARSRTTSRAAAVQALGARHAPAIAAAVLVLSVAGAAAAVAAARFITPTPYLDGGDVIYVACQLFAYGVVGAVLVARRPDLPFGWLLSLAAMALVTVLALAGPSVIALEHGRGGALAVWGLASSALLFVPAALEGTINVRFPSGAPTGRWGHVLDRAIVIGIVVAVVGGVLGDSAVRAIYPDGPPGGAARFLDGTAVIDIANAATLAVPAVILLGIVAGIGVVVRFLRATGIERQQLKWRAVGVIGTLALFPLVVTEVLPPVLDDVVADVAPMWFVATLAVPVLRYDLWAIDSIIRRSAVATFTSPHTVVENTVRVAAEMLRLPYVAMRRGDRIVAAAGEPTDRAETWPVIVDGEPVAELVAAPRFGYEAIAAADRQILATVAQLVGGSVRAEALTADLLDTRQRLVTAREEERRRLRRDLHDDLGPVLTGLGLNLDAAAARLGTGNAVAPYLANARAASSQAIGGLRDLIDGLRPPALDELGLAGALKLALERLTTGSGVDLDLRVRVGEPLPAAVEVAAFRTAVEAVTNAARHSSASRVGVDLVVDGRELAVTVRDDGRTRTPWRPGVGLVGMRERAEELGGTLTAGPTPEGGCVRARYPLGGGP